MEKEGNAKDFYWKLMENKKEKIIEELKEREIHVDYDPKKLIEMTFPNLNKEEIYKVWSLNKLLNKFFEEENKDKNAIIAEN